MMIGRYIKQFFIKPLELAKTKDIDVGGVETVAVILGPYRNLTTLTVGIAALHPNCQVLNHAGQRILPFKKLNFFKNQSRVTFTRFLKYAIYSSGGGKRGDYGGSITYSHAFTRPKLKELYRARYGDKLVKDNIKCLFWKESLRVSNYIKKRRIDLISLIDKTPELRFIMPVRNPLDCAKSNLKTGHARFIRGLNERAGIKETVSAILDEHLWFLKLKDERDKNFFYFFQNDLSKDALGDFASFLRIEPDEKWLDDAMAVYNLKSSYSHPPDLIEHYKSEVEAKFGYYTKFAEKLLEFAELSK